MNKQAYNNIHYEFMSANYEGAFFPNSLLLFIDFPENAFLGNRAAYRTLWHEYMHFLQCTTTTYGINIFMRELELAKLTIACVQDIKKITSNIKFPLMLWHKNTNEKTVLEVLDTYIKYRAIIEEDLATLQGACTYDTKSKRIVYQGKPVFNQAGCPFQDYYQDPTCSVPVPVGSRAIMEGAASLLEFLYLTFLDKMGGDPECKAMSDEWAKNKEDDYAYYVTIDMATHFLKNEGEGCIAKLLALSDLALCPPVEFTPLSCRDDVQRYPGRRFIEALKIAAESPQMNLVEFHDRYHDFVGNICSRLGWPLPWDMASNSLINHIENEYLSSKNDPFCDLIGPALVILNGLTLRKRYPMYCANPIPNIAEAFRIANTRKAEGKGAAIIHWEMIYNAHTPPFVKMRDGHRMLSKLAKKAMVGQIEMNEDELFLEVTKSFEKYFFILRLSSTLWTGRNMINGAIKCLQLDASQHDYCNGYFLKNDNQFSNDCKCRDMFHDFFGFYPNDVEWLL